MTQEFVTLPRDVVEQALELWENGSGIALGSLLESILDHPQVEQEPVAWIIPNALEWRTRESAKIVEMTRIAQPEYDFTEPLYTRPQNLRCKSTQARLATLWGYEKPQPPTTEQSSVVQQPKGEQEPDAWLHSEGKAQPLYLHQQPKREPLDGEEILRLWDEVDGWFNFARAIEAAHNIK